MTNEIATTDAPSNPLASLLSDPERLSAIPVETVERLWAMQKEMDAQAQREAFSDSMARVKARMTPVEQLHRNSQTGSVYAKLEDVQAMLDPLLAVEMITYSASTVPCELADHMRIRLLLRRHGYEESHYLDAPVDDKGTKGQANKTRLHGMGSTMKFCTRYLLCSVFGVQVGGDNDGNTSKDATPVTDEQVANLKALAEEVGASLPKFLVWLRVPSLAELPAARYQEAVQALEARRS